VTVLDPRVVAALREQLASWRAALDAGAERVGWKIGLNVPEVQARLGLHEPVIGHLTSATRLPDGGTYAAGDPVALRAEPEVAVRVGADVPAAADADTARAAIAALAPAIELVDVGRPPGGVEGIVAGNVFHRAFAIGPERPAVPHDAARAVLRANGAETEAADVPGDFADVVGVVARHLEAAGEALRAGDVIIAGSLTPQVPVGAGDRLELDAGTLGAVAVAVGP
jgi:2-keto-4-pentenoate hydratase